MLSFAFLDEFKNTLYFIYIKHFSWLAMVVHICIQFHHLGSWDTSSSLDYRMKPTEKTKEKQNPKAAKLAFPVTLHISVKIDLNYEQIKSGFPLNSNVFTHRWVIFIHMNQTGHPKNSL